MSTTSTTTSSLDGLRAAIEARDADGQLERYAPDAVLRIVDATHGPSAPLELAGRDAIAAYLADVCARDMTHTVTDVLADGDRAAFSVACRYADGTRVLCAAIARLEDGRIAEQTIVQAWDA